MTRAELLALPAAVPLDVAARALTVGRTKAHEMARSGTWPTKLLRLGSVYRIPTAELLRLLGISPDMDGPGVLAPGHVTTASTGATPHVNDT